MTSDEFDQAYWERHWSSAGGESRDSPVPVNPYLPDETGGLRIGSALDAGCGTGTAALWLAERGWQVTGADISGSALATATARARDLGVTGGIEWVETDLTSWEPDRKWDLVTTSYAHPATGQLAFYQRLAPWVAPNGTMLIVAHDRHDHDDQAAHAHPEHATATVRSITELFAGDEWRIGASRQNTRTVGTGGGAVRLHDVVVRVHRAR